MTIIELIKWIWVLAFGLAGVLSLGYLVFLLVEFAGEVVSVIYFAWDSILWKRKK